MLFFSVALTLALGVSFLLYLFATQEIIRAQNPVVANVWAQQHIIVRHSDVWGKSPASASLGIGVTDGIQNEFRHIVENIIWRMRRHHGTNTRFIADPDKAASIYIGASTQPEPHENDADVLAHFPKHQLDFDPESPANHIERTGDSEKYHYFEEVRMTVPSECYACHQFDHGELMGIVHVEIPMSSMRRTMQRNFAYILAATIVSICLALAAVNVVIRWTVIKPLRNLRGVAESISRGEIKKRADLRRNQKTCRPADRRRI